MKRTVFLTAIFFAGCGEDVDLDALQSTVASQRDLIQTMQTDLDTLRADLEALQGDVEDNTSQLSRNTTSMAEQATALEGLEGDVADHGQRILALEAGGGVDLTAIEEAIDSLGFDVYQQGGEIDALVATTAGLTGSVSSLNSSVSTLSGSVSTLQSKVSTLETQVASRKSTLDDFDDLNAVLFLDTAGDVVVEGVNLRVRNGVGTTWSANGDGNLILGYDESTSGHYKSGSHNLVMGPYNGYTSYGGIIGGYYNNSSAPYCVMLSGYGNTCSGEYGVVATGEYNTGSE